MGSLQLVWTEWFSNVNCSVFIPFELHQYQMEKCGTNCINSLLGISQTLFCSSNIWSERYAKPCRGRQIRIRILKETKLLRLQSLCSICWFEVILIHNLYFSCKTDFFLAIKTWHTSSKKNQCISHWNTAEWGIQILFHMNDFVHFQMANFRDTRHASINRKGKKCYDVFCLVTR